jgi:hypothetical protein
MPSIREAIEALLAKPYKTIDRCKPAEFIRVEDLRAILTTVESWQEVIDNYRRWCAARPPNHIVAEVVTDLLDKLDAILAAPEPPREELRGALEKIIEWCDGTRGADIGKGPFEAIRDCARAALYGSPSEEPLREKLKDAAINKALDRIAFLTDSGDYHGYRSEMWSAVAEVFDAALSRGSAPAKVEQKCSLCGGSGIMPKSHDVEGYYDDEDRSPEQIALMADLTAKVAQCSCIWNPGSNPDPKCSIHGDPAAPQFLTMTQPKIDFVLDLSQAEADRLGPPAPKRWRCKGCGKLIYESEIELDQDEVRCHIDWSINDLCGPVKEAKP